MDLVASRIASRRRTGCGDRVGMPTSHIVGACGPTHRASDLCRGLIYI